MALTVKAIQQATYQGDGQSWDVRWDDKVPGLGLRVYPGGTKSFILRYWTRTGRKRHITLGRWGVLTLEQARERARAALVAVADGRDPAAERRAEKARAATVRELAELYLERHSKPRNKTWREDKRRFDTYIVPELGRHAIAAISRADVAALHAKVGRRGKYEANRVLALVSSMFARAAEWGLLAEGAPNPARGVEPFRERARDRWIRPSEMPRLAQAIAAEPNVYVRAAIWLYLLTGVRKGELLRARWSDVDFERAELRLPETKSGEPHVVPLSSVALRVLSEIPRQAGNPYILPGAKRGTHLVNIGKNWRRIREAAGCADVRLHDLRRTVGSWLATAGASLHLVGTVLNHADTDTTRIYARLADDAARRALEEHAARLLEAARADPARMARAEPQRRTTRAKSDT